MGPTLFADTTKRNFQTTTTSIQGDLLVNDLVQSHLKSADQWGKILKALSYVVTEKLEKPVYFSSRLVLSNKVLNSAKSLYGNWVTPKSFDDIQIISAWTLISKYVARHFSDELKVDRLSLQRSRWERPKNRHKHNPPLTIYLLDAHWTERVIEERSLLRKYSCTSFKQAGYIRGTISHWH